MNEFSIGTRRVSEEALKARLEALSQVQYGRHWVKSDLTVGEFSCLSRIVWKISKLLPFLRSFFGAAKPQEIAATLDQIKPQVIHSKELTTVFNRAVTAYNDMVHQSVACIEIAKKLEPPKQPVSSSTPHASPEKQRVTPLQNIQLQDAKNYDPKKTKTVSGLFDMKALMKEQYKGHVEMQKQGEALCQKYYFQNCRGGGDCFYLGYISGWLHHLVQKQTDTPDACKEAIKRLQDHPNTSTEKVIPILEDLEKMPTLENLYKHLCNEEEMRAFVQCLRFVARDGIMTIDDGKGGRQFDDDQIAAVIFDNPDFADIEKATNKQEAFAARQSKMGENIQTPEVSVLHRWICPVSICFSQDHLEQTLRGKFAEGYNEGHPITLFQRNNHFDALIPK